MSMRALESAIKAEHDKRPNIVPTTSPTKDQP